MRRTITGRPASTSALAAQPVLRADVFGVGLVHDDGTALRQLGEKRLPFVTGHQRAGRVVRVAEPDQPRSDPAGRLRESFDVVAMLSAGDSLDSCPRRGGHLGVEPVGRARHDHCVSGVEKGVRDGGDERLDPVAGDDQLGTCSEPGGDGLSEVRVSVLGVHPRPVELAERRRLERSETGRASLRSSSA